MRLPHIALASALGLMACAPHEETPPAEVTHKSLVQLELGYGREQATTRLSADAHFVRYRAADREVDERAVAGLLGISLGDGLAVDTCALDPDVESIGAGALEVALLDAGVLTVGRDQAPLTELVPQHYPELLPFVSGVVYATEVEGEAAQPAAGEHLRITAEGGEDVGPFSASVAAPAAFPGLRAQTLPRDLELDWSASGPGAAQPAGELTIELRWNGAQPGAARCRVLDDGRFLVPRGLSAGFDSALAAGAVHVSAARSASAVLDAPGAGPGRLIVTLRDAVTPTAQP